MPDKTGGRDEHPNMPDVQRIFEEGEKLLKTEPPKHLPSYEFVRHVGRFCTHDRPHEVVKLTTWIQDTSKPVFGVVPLNDGHRAPRKHNMVAVEEYLCRRCKLSFHWSVDPAREAEIIQARPDWKKGLEDGS